MTTQSSGPCLRTMKQIQRMDSEVEETFGLQKSFDLIREKVEIVEVVEANIQPEVGTEGKPRITIEPVKIDYSAIDLYSEAVMAEEILF
jgi:hypothetical protein